MYANCIKGSTQYTVNPMTVLNFRGGSFWRSGVRLLTRAIQRYPKMSLGILSLPVLHFYLQRRATRALRTPIFTRLKEGSTPHLVPVSFVTIQRPKLGVIKKLLEGKKSTTIKMPTARTLLV